MNTPNIIILIFCIMLFLIILFIVVFKIFNDKIKDILYKLENTEDSIKDLIKEKHNILIKIIKIIEDKLKVQSKTFDKIKKTKTGSTNLLKSDQEFIKCYNEITNIIEDNKSKKVNELENIIEKYEENELHIISLRTYYNKNIIIYNNIINKFPYNIISFLKKYKLKLLFDGNEIEVDD